MGANAMNACKKTQALLFESADGRTAPAAQADLEAHLADCPHCKQVFAAWTGALPRLRSMPIDEPSAVAVRRMENEVLRQLEPSPACRSRRPLWLALAAGLLLAAGVGAAVVRSTAPQPLARIETLWGHVTLSGAAMSPGATMAAGAVLDIADEGEASFIVGRQAGVRLLGPGRVTLIGTSRQPRLRLDGGRLRVEISHRQAGETFVVATSQGHIEVRGTRFVVGYAAHGSYVHVEEGEVAAFRDGVAAPFAVRAGETFPFADGPQGASSTAEAAAAPIEAPAAGTPEAAGRCPQPNCSEAAGQARKAMRRGNPAHAIELVDEAIDRSGDCPAAARCLDELGYLRAEALRQAGRIEAAVAAYQALNRPGATRAMRQNALYAAGLLERRLGRSADARQSFEHALAANPDGVLAEEALAGLVELAQPGSAEARASAERYLARYPHGMAAARARRILSDAPGSR
jgi:ferric-dicitrate binding protein FerR (iron transport regulator)